MNAQRNKEDIKSTAIEKKRRVNNLEDKLHMINKYEADHAANYKQLGRSASTSSWSQTTRNRSHLVTEMETLLSVWIEHCNQERIPLSQMTIKTKALNLSETLKRKQVENENYSVSVMEEIFSASSGWFDRFKKRSGIHNVRVRGEIASADEKAAASFPGGLQQIIEKGNYTDEQIFNVDETGLLWKKGH
jgi:hypothetical protein